jgi:hypothetical protein
MGRWSLCRPHGTNKCMLLALYLSSTGVVRSTIWAFSSTQGPSRLSTGRSSVILGTTGGKNIPDDLSFRDSWSLICLGDLHMEDDMSYHEEARRDCVQAMTDYPLLASSSTSSFEKRPLPFALTDNEIEAWENTPAKDLTLEQLEILVAQKRYGSTSTSRFGNPSSYCMVSLGDLGRKDIRHEPGDAGTTKSFSDAKEFFNHREFGNIPFEVVTGNHDLEGLDEFDTDEKNLQAWMECFNKKTPQFSRYLGDRTLLLGLSTVRFRAAPYSSHEVHVNQEQIDWFVDMVESHPAKEGWKILVFSHAPITGSGLRVLQSVHVTNGCAWLNHCSDADTRNMFIRTVQNNPQIKVWFSGHFHLSHDYQDALVQAGTCTFVQVGVVGPQSTRDGNRQSRFIRGCGQDCIEIYSINHHIRSPSTTSTGTNAQVRLDATIDLRNGLTIFAQDDERAGKGSNNTSTKNPDWFQAFVPREEDGCYLEDPDGIVLAATEPTTKVCWWHMADGKVLGFHKGQLVEYDAETLSPLGVVVTEKHLRNREILVVQDRTTLVLVDDNTQEMEVIHPNGDGSYWKKFQRNKKIRLEEKAREEVAKRWLEQKNRSSRGGP